MPRAGMEVEAPIEGLLDIERESAVATSVTSASRAQQQFLECVPRSQQDARVHAH